MIKILVRHGIAIVAMLCLLLSASLAHAADTPPDQPPLSLNEGEARTLIKQGKFDEALAILRPLAKAHPKHTNTHFLLGIAAIESSRIAETQQEQTALLDEAITVLRQILIDQPGLVRVRLELARAFFYKKEDRLARQHFERVLAGNPPDPVIANVQRFLAEMRERRNWSMYLGAAVAPRTNIGRTSDAEIIEIFGLPFRRDTDDLETSGIGLSIWTGGDYQIPINQRLQLQLGADLAREEYPGNQFDQSFVSVDVGPRWLMNPKTIVSLAADARRRWLSTNPYYLDLGARTEVQHRLTQRVSLTGRASWYDREYRIQRALDGDVMDVSIRATWLYTPIVQFDGTLGYGTEHTKGKTWRNDSWLGRLGVSVALPRGFNVGASGEYRRTQYEGNWFPFTDGSSRRDHTRIVRASVYNRGFTLFGFSPQLVVSREERTTNAQTHEYQDTNGELRLIRQF
ncbi:MAG: surface lipoprotein assembly modifier [Gammaproteobacteria bacterium]|nr:surface lipoprotein assembly modifier [Gammaproteobacteria bacterium]